MKRTLNGITCEIASNGASRWARFTVDGWEYCKVSQNADAVNLTMASCRFHWSCSNPGGDTIIQADLQAEALRQAIKLAREWEQDAGKPMKEVLSGN